jgi:hypothetical protein
MHRSPCRNCPGAKVTKLECRKECVKLAEFTSTLDGVLTLFGVIDVDLAYSMSW